MILGIDTSTYFDEVEAKAKYYDESGECDPLKLFLNNGVTHSRIRVWNNPYSNDGKKYLAGTCDLDNFIKLAKLQSQLGYKLLLDFHYSDFWADPGKQTIPKVWKNLSLKELEQKVYEFTKESLIKILDNDLDLSMIQIGNEITNGMLWPIGKLVENTDGERSNYDSLCLLLKAGIKAAREIYPHAKIILHLERSNNHKIYDEFFTNMERFKVDYDIIGASYYPYWHGTMDEVFDNLNNKFNKEIMIVELGYGFTLEDYILNGNGDINLVVNKDNLDSFLKEVKYPLTPLGQANFVEDFLKKAKLNNISGIFYWEPLWIPGDGVCWASKEGQEYIGSSSKSTRNEWANQCLFDYNGKKLPAFDKFKI